MPMDSIIVTVCVTAVFVAFAAVLAFGMITSGKWSGLAAEDALAVTNPPAPMAKLRKPTDGPVGQ
jgi:uncharacterized membrane protein